MFQCTSTAALFYDQVKQQQQQKTKSRLVRQNTTRSVFIKLMIHTTMNDQRLVQLFGLWSSRSWSTVTKFKGGQSKSSTKASAVGW